MLSSSTARSPMVSISAALMASNMVRNGGNRSEAVVLMRLGPQLSLLVVATVYVDRPSCKRCVAN